jgi:hypothetical protein
MQDKTKYKRFGNLDDNYDTVSNPSGKPAKKLWRTSKIWYVVEYKTSFPNSAIMNQVVSLPNMNTFNNF